MALRSRVVTAGTIVMSATLLIGMNTAGAAGVQVKPGTFVGTAADCGDIGPAGTKKGVAADWVAKAGLPDAGGSNHGLVLTKSDPTNGCSAAGANVEGVAGMVAG